MKQIVISSKNPVKIQATLLGFEAMFPGEYFEVRSVTVPSGVPDQPVSDGETLLGAITRARNAKKEIPQADFWVGIEGGVDTLNGELVAFAWVVVLNKKQQGKSRTGTFFLPEAVKRLVDEGMELGEADDIVFNRRNSKQGSGAVGILTDDLIDRTSYYHHAVILALIPFKNQDLYEEVQ